MLKRTIVITSPSYLSLKDRQLVCSNKEDPGDIKTAPVEDLSVVLIENQRASLTLPLINALTDSNVAIVYCDAHGMPSSIVTSLSANASQSEMLRAQLSASDSFKDRLWKQIIEAKIENQMKLLNKLGKNGAKLHPFLKNVKTGDSDNREGIAARLFWNELFGKEFVRSREGSSPNNLLNYGYSILRSAVARALLGSGINPAIGLFHRNKYNPMPLVDDIMEPYRPYVDEIVYELYANGEQALSSEVKCYLTDVLSCDTVFRDSRRPLLIGLTTTSASLGKCFLAAGKKIIYPRLE